MSSVKHTPGPWKVNAYDERFVEIAPNLFIHAGSIGDARLVAAAPELLEALKAVVRVADRQTVEFDAARAAIAKAEGN